VLVGFVMDGGQLHSLVEISPMLIVFGGTIFAVAISFPSSVLKKVLKVLKIVIFPPKEDREKIMEDIKTLSMKARKDGLLSLDTEIHSEGIEYDPFLVNGLTLVTDGLDGELIRKTLESRIENIEYRHSKGIAVFESAGGYAPTLGVLGTVMGLIHVLSNLSEPASLGPKIAIAFIATMYGVGSANLLWLPIASRLREIDEEEILTKSMIVEGVIMIYNGSNVTFVEERMRGFFEDEAKERKEE